MTSPISDALTTLCAAFDLDPSYFHISEAEKRSYLNSMGGLFDSQIDRILSAMKAKEEAADQSAADEVENLANEMLQRADELHRGGRIELACEMGKFSRKVRALSAIKGHQ